MHILQFFVEQIKRFQVQIACSVDHHIKFSPVIKSILPLLFTNSYPLILMFVSEEISFKAQAMENDVHCVSEIPMHPDSGERITKTDICYKLHK